MILSPATTVAILLTILPYTFALPTYPSSNLIPRRISKSTTSGDTLVTDFDVTDTKPPAPFMIGDTPPTICATPGREQNYSTTEILTRMSDFAKSYPSSYNGFFSPILEFPGVIGATVGIDPEIPATYAEGCVTDAAFLWASMSGDPAQRTDIVVFNYDVEGFTVAFCGIMTNADEGEDDKQYHLCNRQPGTVDERLTEVVV